MTRRKVAVLMGGVSAERDVSLSTGRQILGALDDRLYHCHGAGHRRSLASPDGADPDRPDVVFIALHGPGGEDGTVQGMLEVLGHPLHRQRRPGERAGDGQGDVQARPDIGGRPDAAGRDGPPGRLRGRRPRDWLALPVIVKPNRQGSTIGMSVVRDPSEMEAALANAFLHDDTALVESFVAGTEITVPVLGNADLEVLPVVEIVPAGGFYDYQAKYTPGATEEIVPARIPEAVTAEARRIAQLCHRALGCRGMSRTDMIVTPEGEIYTLEVNTIPGMTPTSLLPRSAEAAGLPFPRLLDRLIDLALEPNHA